MNRQQLLDLYDWEPGICFRHPAKGVVETAHVETVRPSAGGLQDVRACRECIVEIENCRERAAARRGAPYSPGRIGDGCEGE